MTREQFDLSIARLTMLRGTPENADHFFGAVEDIPADLFELACQRSLRTRIWFPTPAEIRVDADASRPPARYEPEPDRFVAGSGKRYEIRNPFGGPSIVVTVEREWHDDCERCRDLGVRSWWCGTPSGRYLDVPSLHCGRRGDHAPHEWVNACDCVEWNPTIRRRRSALQASYARPAEKV